MKKILSLILAICLSASLFALDWTNPLEDVVYTHNEDYSEWQAELKGVGSNWYYKPTVVLSSNNNEDCYVDFRDLWTYFEDDPLPQADILELVSKVVRYNTPFVGLSFYENCAYEFVVFIHPESKKIAIFMEFKKY